MSLSDMGFRDPGFVPGDPVSYRKYKVRMFKHEVSEYLRWIKFMITGKVNHPKKGRTND